MARRNILPYADLTKVIAATTTSLSVSFSSVNGKRKQYRVYNAGSSLAFVRQGTGTVTAVVSTSGQAGDMPVPSGAIEVFDMGENDVIAAITASGGATVYVTLCEGKD